MTWRWTLATLLVACSSPSGAIEPTRDDANADANAPPSDPSPEPTFDPTFTAIYSEVLLTSSCTLGLCHGQGARGGALDLGARDDAFESLVGVASQSVKCGPLGFSLVVPRAPAESLLLLKLGAEPPCGKPMPPDELLSHQQIDQIRNWIERGAPND